MAKSHIIEGIISYPALDKPRANSNNDDDDKSKPKYGVTLVITPEFQQTPQFAALVEDAKEVAVEKFGKKGPSMVTTGGKGSTFRNDGNSDKGYPEGSVRIAPKNENAPGLVYPWADPATIGVEGKKPQPAVVPADKITETFYPGAKVRASVKPYAYDRKGNKGITFALNNLQFLGHGQRLDGRKAATEEFEADLSATPESLEDASADLLG